MDYITFLSAYIYPSEYRFTLYTYEKAPSPTRINF